MSNSDNHGTVKHVSDTLNKCFPSNTMGQLIVNAATGIKYDICVGSKESLRLFKVIDTSGKYDKNGNKRKNDDVKKIIYPEPNHFYFDNPQEYSQHRRYLYHHSNSEKWKDFQTSITDNVSGDVDLNKYKTYKKDRKNSSLIFVESVHAC